MSVRRRIIIIVVLPAVLVGIGVFALVSWNQRNDVRVISIDRSEPGLVSLLVDSCNATHQLTATDLDAGNRYQVSVERTSRGSPGEDCGDIVGLPIEPDLEIFEVEDLVSGDVFEWPPLAPPLAVGVDGRWTMVEVNGEPVEVGVNTAVIPRFEIEAGFLSGNFGCNAGESELLQDGAQLRGTVVLAAALCTTPGSDGQQVPTERVMLDMLRSSNGATVTIPSDQGMIWQSEVDELVFERR